MTTRPLAAPAPAEQAVKDTRRATHKLHSSAEKIGIVPCDLRGEDRIADLCRKARLAQSLYDSWSKETPEAGSRRLAGDPS